MKNENPDTLSVRGISEQRASAHFAADVPPIGAAAPKTPLKYRPIKINLTEAEYTKVKSYSKKCGLTVTAMFRTLLNNYQPKPLPDTDFREIVQKLYVLYRSVRQNETAERLLHEIILGFEKAALSPERSAVYGGNKSLGD